MELFLALALGLVASAIAAVWHLYGRRPELESIPDGNRAHGQRENRPGHELYHLLVRDQEAFWRLPGRRPASEPIEAKTLAEAVMEHAREQLRKPAAERLTLGVATFSTAQMEAILREVEELRQRDPFCEEFLSPHSDEPFFVKDFRSIQDDERDVIFISMGHGRTAEGYLTRSFGTLNRRRAEKRMKDVMSRGRRRCEVFTSLSADDIDLTRMNSTGPFALKTFVTYATTGELDIPLETSHSQGLAFEEQVHDALTRKGYPVHAQVGYAGFYLDFAVVDPERPGRYLLGIECEGPACHTAHSADDRDHLRRAVLEILGWRIHRVGSTDWFRDPEKELNKIAQAIEIAKRQPMRPAVKAPTESARLKTPDAISPPSAAERRLDGVPVAPLRSAGPIPKYQLANLEIPPGLQDLHLVDHGQLAQWLAQVVAVESPVHWLEAARRVANAAGVERLGSRTQIAFRLACQSGLRAGVLANRGVFLWRRDMTSPALRDRSELPRTAKKIEYVAPEEIEAAMERVAGDADGITGEDVAGAACRLLGFARLSDEMRVAVEKQRDALVAAGRLVLNAESPVSRKGAQPAQAGGMRHAGD